MQIIIIVELRIFSPQPFFWFTFKCKYKYFAWVFILYDLRDLLLYLSSSGGVKIRARNTAEWLEKKINFKRVEILRRNPLTKKKDQENGQASSKTLKVYKKCISEYTTLQTLMHMIYSSSRSSWMLLLSID